LVLASLTVATVWTTYRTGIAGALFRPRQNLEFYRTIAILGGLLFYFASGPGAWSWGGGTSRRA
jgi:putative oxidoreductase